MAVRNGGIANRPRRTGGLMPVEECPGVGPRLNVLVADTDGGAVVRPQYVEKIVVCEQIGKKEVKTTLLLPSARFARLPGPRSGRPPTDYRRGAGGK